MTTASAEWRQKSPSVDLINSSMGNRFKDRNVCPKACVCFLDFFLKALS